VIIGHAHGQPWESTPSYIIFEGFEVRNAAPPNAFTDRSGKKSAYSGIAAGIFVERANNLVIRGCTVTGNNTGIFIGTGGGAVALTQNVLLEQNYIHDNGSLADYYEHNVYNEASNVVYQYNRFGPPRGGKNGILGANIKERSAGVVIRYNWIEDGAHILDIVDAQESKDVTRPMPSFHATYVYGNVIIRGTKPTGSMILYGGDSGVLEDYRKGTLFFYDNTVVVKNESYPEYARTAVFELSTNDEHLDSRNNVYFSTVEPNDLHAIGMLGARDQVSSGVATFAGDWVKKGWTAHDLTLGLKVDLRAQIHDLDKMVRGDLPGFRDSTAEEYALVGPGSVGVPVALGPGIPVDLWPTSQYVKHQRGKPRPAPLTLGALGD
jgi:parallel beta-helix repeat protein